MPQNLYLSPLQKKRSFCTLVGSSVYSRFSVSIFELEFVAIDEGADELALVEQMHASAAAQR